MQVTVQQCRDAFVSLSRLGDLQLPTRAAWRVMRLIKNVRSVVEDFEQAQAKTFFEASGIQEGNSIVIKEPVRGEQGDEEWAAFMAQHMEKVASVQTKMAELNDEVVTIEYDKIPLELFDGVAVSPNDFANLEMFLVE